MRSFLAGAGLGRYADSLVDFGADHLSDLNDADIVSDEALAEVGMGAEDIQRFRTAVAELLEIAGSPPSSSMASSLLTPSAGAVPEALLEAVIEAEHQSPHPPPATPTLAVAAVEKASSTAASEECAATESATVSPAPIAGSIGGEGGSKRARKKTRAKERGQSAWGAALGSTPGAPVPPSADAAAAAPAPLADAAAAAARSVASEAVTSTASTASNTAAAAKDAKDAAAVSGAAGSLGLREMLALRRGSFRDVGTLLEVDAHNADAGLSPQGKPLGKAMSFGALPLKVNPAPQSAAVAPAAAAAAADLTPRERQAHAYRVAEAEVRSFLAGAGLGHYADSLVDFGADHLSDLNDADIVSDEALAEVGMGAEDIQRFRTAVAALQARLRGSLGTGNGK